MYTMNMQQWIKFFEEMDINQPPVFHPSIAVGTIGKSFVQDNKAAFEEHLRALKSQLGVHLSDYAILHRLKKIPNPEPEMPNFGHGADREGMAEAFYQLSIDTYRFYNEYKGYLTKKLKQGNKVKKGSNRIKKPQVSNYDLFLSELETITISVIEKYQTGDGYEDELIPAEMPGLPFKIGQYLDLTQYNQKDSNYQARLRELQQLAIAEILKLDTLQIQRQLRWIDQIIRRLNKACEISAGLLIDFLQKPITVSDLQIKLSPLLNISKHESGLVTAKFLEDLCDALFFKEAFLKGFIEQVNETIGNIPLDNRQERDNSARAKKLKVNQIALIHIYERKQITRENGNQIAANYGYNSKTSGEGLFQDYTFYCNADNRREKPTPCTQKKLANKIQLFKSILPHLENKAAAWANDEINILESHFENEYQ